MPEVAGIRDINPYKPLAINQTADIAKGLNITEKGQALIKEVVGLLGSERSVRVTNTLVSARGETGTVIGATGIPAIDNPDDPVAKNVDLEKLILHLQLKNAEERTKTARDNINVRKDTLASGHKDRMEKLNKSLEKMDKAARTNMFNKIFGWIMAAVAVVVAVAACVATGGLAVGPCIGAAIALGSCIMNETGAMDKLIEGIAGGLEKLGLSKDAAKIIAQVAMALVIMAATIATCGIGAGAAVSSATSSTVNTARMIAENIQKGADVAMKLMAIAGVISNGVGAGQNYAAGQAQADVTEMTKVLAQLRQQLQDSEDDLQAILELIQDTFSNLVAILDSATDTQKTIAQQMANMA